jgi:hypothetical protein
MKITKLEVTLRKKEDAHAHLVIAACVVEVYYNSVNVVLVVVMMVKVLSFTVASLFMFKRKIIINARKDLN